MILSSAVSWRPCININQFFFFKSLDNQNTDTLLVLMINALQLRCCCYCPCFCWYNHCLFSVSIAVVHVCAFCCWCSFCASITSGFDLFLLQRIKLLWPESCFFAVVDLLLKILGRWLLEPSVDDHPAHLLLLQVSTISPWRIKMMLPERFSAVADLLLKMLWRRLFVWRWKLWLIDDDTGSYHSCCGVL